MSDIIRQLHTDHINVARLLDLLEQEIQMIHTEETPDYALMFDAMHYMVHYPDLVHHPTEDLIFEKLKDREPGTGDEVDRLTAEHQVLADRSTRFLELLRHIENETMMVSRVSVETQGKEYISLLRKHMSEEEGQVFPRVQQVLIDEDWGEIGGALKRQEDPVFGKIVVQQYRTLYDCLVP